MTPDRDHLEMRSLMGPYLLGGLDSADRRRLEEHLGRCRSCEQELARLAPVPGLLGRLREQPEPAEPPPADLLPRILEESVRERRSFQRRTVLRTVLAAAAVVAVALLGVRLVGAPEEPAGTTVALRAATGQDASGSAYLTTKPWGTEMRLTLDGMPDTGPFRLEVTGADGSSQVAATWGTTPTGASVVSGATALTPDDLRHVRVVGPDGTVLEGPVAGG